MHEPKIEEPEIAAPSAVRVVQRAQVLAAISCRGFLDQDPGLPSSAEMFEKLRPWLSATGAAGELEPRERTQLTTPVGTLPGGSGLAWQIESTAMLAWALGLMDPPPLYVQLEPGPVARAVSFLEPVESMQPDRPTLRPTSEIQQMANLFSRATGVSVTTASAPIAWTFKRLQKAASGLT